MQLLQYLKFTWWFKQAKAKGFGKQFSIIIRSLHLIADTIHLLYQIQSLLQNHMLLLQ